MRGAQLQALIVAGIEALEVDDKAVDSDKFRHDEGQSDDGNVKPDRVFELIQGQVSPNTMYGAQALRTVFELRFYYADSSRLASRLISDAERVLTYLPTIGAAMHPDCYGCGELGDWIPAEDEVPGQIVCVVSFAVFYSLTGV